MPLDNFLLCPPRPVDQAAPPKPIGVQLIEIGGITMSSTRVGASHYPNVADVIAELRDMG